MKELFNNVLFFLFAVVATTTSANAAMITLALNPNSTTEPAGYKLYYGQNSREMEGYPFNTDLGWHQRDVQFDITLPDLEPGKKYYFAATAYDGSWNESSFSAEVSKTVPPLDRPPIVIAGNDLVVTEGDTVILDGSGSYDPDNNALTYLWSQVSGTSVTIINPTSAIASFTAPVVAADENLVFMLSITANGVLVTDTVTVTVLNTVPPSFMVADGATTAGFYLTGGTGTLVSTDGKLILSATSSTSYTSYGINTSGVDVVSMHNFGTSFNIMSAAVDAYFVLKIKVRDKTTGVYTSRNMCYCFLTKAATSTNAYYNVSTILGTTFATLKASGVWSTLARNIDTYVAPEILTDLSVWPNVQLISVDEIRIYAKGIGQVISIDYLVLFADD